MIYGLPLIYVIQVIIEREAGIVFKGGMKGRFSSPLLTNIHITRTLMLERL